MNEPNAAPRPPDFSALDFERLWKGRSKTTQVESLVLRVALERVGPERLLEIGSGGGRVTPWIRARATEFVATDVTRPFVERLDRRWAEPPSGFRAAANAYRLPFVDATFSAVVAVRVFNFFADPSAALSEIGRVLRPGGHLILSYEPKPSLGTLSGDLRVALAPHPRPFVGQTFSRTDPAPVRPSSFPAWAPSRRRMSQWLRDSGYQLEGEWGSGLEDFRPFRWLPTAVFLPAGTAFGRTATGVFPSRFVLARSERRAGASEGPRSLAASVACPRCSTPTGFVDLAASWSHTCTACGFSVQYRDAILDAVDPVSGPRAPTHGPATAT
jgi:ubiquinone/menaquinone biosynthesis C-methylase UbiE